MNINSYYPPAGPSFSHQPLALHDNAAGHQLSNGFHHSVSAAGFMSPTHYSSRPICPGYDIPGSQSKAAAAARFVADGGDDPLMRSGTADVNATPTRDGAYGSLGDPSPHHPHVHHHLHHHQHPQPPQQQVSRWPGMTVQGDGPIQTSSPPPPSLIQTSAFNHAVPTGAVTHHLNRPATADPSPPAAVSCQSPHSAITGFNSSGHIPFYPWMGVVGKCMLHASLFLPEA